MRTNTAVCVNRPRPYDAEPHLVDLRLGRGGVTQIGVYDEGVAVRYENGRSVLFPWHIVVSVTREEL